MAAIAADESQVGNWRIYTWSDVTEDDTFAAISPRATDRAVVAMTAQFSGTFGAATVIMQGSNDDSTFVALDDIEDTAISHTTAGGSELRYAWPYMRPSASGGTSQSLTATLAVQFGGA